MLRSAVLILSLMFSFTVRAEIPAVEFKALPGESINGHKLTFADLTGKVVLVDFWATWCEPCKKAIPHYDELAKKYKDKIVVIGINEDDNVKDRDAYIKKNPVSFAMFADNKKQMVEQFKIPALPTLYIFDKNMKAAASFRGFDPKKNQELEKTIQDLLK